MKILLWPTHYLPHIGGLEVMAHSLALELKKMGHEIIVIANHFDTIRFKEFILEGISVYSFPFTPALESRKLSLVKAICDRINALFDEFGPDVVNAHGWFECFAFFQTRILQNRTTPLCITVHGLLEQSHYDTSGCKQLWQRASAINTVSYALVESLKEYRLHHKAIQTIHNGLAKPTLPLAPHIIDPPTLLMIGRLTEEKRFDIGFHALKLLLSKYPNLKLTLVGGGPDFEALSQLKSALQLDDAITMTDYVPPSHVQNYIDKATIILVPSYYESFSLVALQAAQRARPVIASNVYGLKEVIEHGKTGLLVPPNKPEPLADAIDQLLSDQAMIKKMGKAAMERSNELFTIEMTAQNYAKMYRNILEQTFVPC